MFGKQKYFSSSAALVSNRYQNKVNSKTKTTAWLLIAAIAAVLWVPNLLAAGMFIDGIVDAILAQSLYLHISSFWEPKSQAGSWSWGTMPLSIYMLSLFYKIFGDHYCVERIYSFVCALLQLGLIYQLWKTFFANEESIKKQSWLPCLLWMISPLTGWCYGNNLMENTMTLFTTCAILVSLYFVQTQKNILACAFLAAVFLLLAFITKGPVSLFVFAVPFLFIHSNKKFDWTQAVKYSVLQIFFIAVLFGLLFTSSSASIFFQNYLNEQIKPALVSPLPTQLKSLTILLDLVLVISPFLLLCGFSFWVKPKMHLLQKSYWRFLLLGLCGSLPIMISNKQKQFYLLPAMVPLVIGFAIYLLPLVEWLNEKIKETWQQKIIPIIKYGSIATILLCVVLCFTQAGTFVRDNDLLSDLQQVNALTKSETAICADDVFFERWSLKDYLLRLYRKRVCLAHENIKTSFYLTLPNQVGGNLPLGSKKIMAGKTLDLYQTLQ